MGNEGKSAFIKVKKLLLALQGKVDKITGKGLSTNDFTNNYKNLITSHDASINQLDAKIPRVIYSTTLTEAVADIVITKDLTNADLALSDVEIFLTIPANLNIFEIGLQINGITGALYQDQFASATDLSSRFFLAIAHTIYSASKTALKVVLGDVISANLYLTRSDTPSNASGNYNGILKGQNITSITSLKISAVSDSIPIGTKIIINGVNS